jgi:hypothetical protein
MRTFAVDVSAAEDGDYDVAFELVRGLGMGRIGVTLNWNMIECAPWTYDASVLEMVNAYYAWKAMPIDLTISPISTNVSVVPVDLWGRRWNHPHVIARFKALLDFVFSQLPDVEIRSLVIGSEVEGRLITQTSRRRYAAFYEAVASYARTKRPGLRVAVEVGLDALVGSTASYYAQLNASSDVIGVSYYPMTPGGDAREIEGIEADFAGLVDRYPSQPIAFYQLGYPSSPLLGSSPEEQARFIREVFRLWDVYAQRIELIDFTFLYDMREADVEYFMHFYGLTGEKAAAFFRTLGLRDPAGAGTDKPAFTELREQVSTRSWP